MKSLQVCVHSGRICLIVVRREIITRSVSLLSNRSINQDSWSGIQKLENEENQNAKKDTNLKAKRKPDHTKHQNEAKLQVYYVIQHCGHQITMVLEASCQHMDMWNSLMESS
jgi:hypothetical protein